MSKDASVAAARTSYNVRSIEKVLDLLDVLCSNGGDVRLAELSNQLGLGSDDVFRMLATLESRGLVVRDESSLKYSLGLSAYEMGQKLLSGMAMMRKSRPVMEQLARTTDEAVYLMVPCEDELLMLEMVDSCQKVKVAPLVGRRLPLTATSLGKFFQAFAPLNGKKGKKGKKETSLSDDSKNTSHSNHLFDVAEDESAFGDGVATLGIPLFNAREQVVAVLAIIGPTFRVFSEQRRKELLGFLETAGMVLSTSLGYVSPYLRTSHAIPLV